MPGSRILLPIFPLSNVVLFPGIKTTLHIFEPRYRQLTEHALASDRQIVMVVVRPEHAADMAADPPVFPTGCAGTIREVERYPDGRFDIVVHGSRRVRIDDEPARPGDQLYRTAAVTLLDDPFELEDVGRVARLRRQVIDRASELFGDRAAEISDAAFQGIDDRTFVNALCAALPFSAPEKQALLEVAAVPDRFEALIETLCFALAERGSRRVPNSRTFH